MYTAIINSNITCSVYMCGVLLNKEEHDHGIFDVDDNFAQNLGRTVRSSMDLHCENSCNSLS